MGGEGVSIRYKLNEIKSPNSIIEEGGGEEEPGVTLNRTQCLGDHE